MRARPNIVSFLASDLGYGDLACYGSPANRTPCLDQLAAGGVRFTDFHSNGAMCSPSRAAFLTGLYQQRVGVEFVLNHGTREQPPMHAEARTFGHAFGEAGYATGFFGVHHTGYLPEQSPLRCGFDEFVGLCGGMDHHSHVTRWGQPNWWHGETLRDEEGYASDLIATHAVDFIARHRERPFCLHVADFAVHFPWQGPRDPSVFRQGENNDHPDKKYGDPAVWSRAYREMVEVMDANVGRIRQALRVHGLAENTLFVFTTDHGGQHLVADNGPFSGAKGGFREGGHRIPAIVSWPGVLPAGRMVNATTMLMDLFPTFLDACGLPRTDGPCDGVSLWPLLASGSPLPERTLFWRQGMQKAVRRGDWKLLHEPNGPGLYNLATDPREIVDRSADEPGIVARLQKELGQWEEDVGAPLHT